MARHAHARRAADLAVLDREGHGEGAHEALGKGGHLGGLGDLGLQDRELVAAEARHEIDVAQRAAEALGHPSQEHVAHGVAEGVVHLRVAVEVEVEEREGPCAAVHAGDRLL